MPLDSEEELVYFTHDNSLPLQDNVITKTTEFKVTESGSRGDEVERVHVMLKPWQRQGGWSNMLSLNTWSSGRQRASQEEKRGAYVHGTFDEFSGQQTEVFIPIDMLKGLVYHGIEGIWLWCEIQKEVLLGQIPRSIKQEKKLFLVWNWKVHLCVIVLPTMLLSAHASRTE
jgi:hypothetical protein